MRLQQPKNQHEGPMKGRDNWKSNKEKGSNDLTKAASVFKCSPQKVQVFTNLVDPLNPTNVLTGGTSERGAWTFCKLNHRCVTAVVTNW